MVPNGWTIKTVGDLFDVQLGKMLNQEAKEKHPQYPYLGNTNVQWARFNLNDLKTMHFDEAEQRKFKLEKNDILMCEGGEVGRCAIWDRQEPIFYQKALHRLRSKGDIEPVFFQNFMQKISGTKLLDDYTTKTSIAHLTQEKLIQIPIRLPPLSEQKKIAQILSTWDKAIATTENLLENSQKQKQALMQQLLTGKKRFGGFSGDWKTILIGEISEIESGTSKMHLISEGGNRYILDMGSVSREGKLIPSKKTNSNEGLLRRGQLIMPKDDIGGGNIIGRVGYVPEDNKFILSDHVYALTIQGHDSLFISYLINSYLVNKSLRRKANGTAQLGLGKKDVSKQKINLPPSIDEQQKIALVLNKSDQEIINLQVKLDLLKNEKKALMQQLLTGKKRVKMEG